MASLMDRIARAALAVGIGMMLQPWWSSGFRYGFFVTAVFTIMHIVTSRLQVIAPEVGAGNIAEVVNEGQGEV